MVRRRRPIVSNLLGVCNSQKIPPAVNFFRTTSWIGTLIILFASTLARAQGLSLTVNDEVCGCSSATYTFVLDFGLTCPPANIETGSGTGVARVSCLISPFGASTTNLSPVVLDSISILELDQSNNVLVEERIGGEFVSGDSFSYSSIINNDITSVQNIPKALQLNLSGRNDEGVMLLNVFVIEFTNECGVTPVIQVGESVGWVNFTQMSGPIPRFCPTFAPSSTPSTAPSSAPSSAPSFNPTATPSNAPSSSPSTAPTQSPTQHPTEPPTQEPTKSPTVPPTTRLPTEEPSVAAEAPTQLPVAVTTANPTLLPTKLPTDDPTQPPTSLPPTHEPTRCPTEPPVSTDNKPTPSPQATATTITEKPTNGSTNRPTNKPTQQATTVLPTASMSPSLFAMSMSMSLTTNSVNMNSFDLDSEFFEEVDFMKEFLSD